MIVLDASCLVELFLQRPGSKIISQRLLDIDEELCAPSLVDVEVCHAMRRFFLLGELTAQKGREVIEELSEFPLERFPHTTLLSRMWELRKNLTAYDAAYVALAEALDAVLLTCDKKLSTVKGHRAKIELIADA